MEPWLTETLSKKPLSALSTSLTTMALPLASLNVRLPSEETLCAPGTLTVGASLTALIVRLTFARALSASAGPLPPLPPSSMPMVSCTLPLKLAAGI